ncbi:cytochrome B [Rhodoblastus sphagnicola]|uniref:Cytochrome B n=1 Tax=Rhodoblastus sphagnicola TaxID=333368 RepID=A0A2S6MX67_9HYPH|nr:cytochrome b/b6 domain-containing protein [Rhodoblastus sphagnicola]MBB4199283.1 cytochrome b [Rhodoblastus sphagnicola]PPQ26951.1 cytochrome B [Rhodoblastus sphagnicola]
MAAPSGTSEDEVLPPLSQVRVWDPVVRLFHWSVVAGCVLNLAVFTDGKGAHRWIGYAVALALAIRIVWGFVGARYARFSEFVPRPSALAAYLKALARGRAPRFLGHNPAGAAMMLALMALLAGVSLTGWMLTLDAWFGDDNLEELHEALANVIVVFAGAHVAAALFESWRHGENLVRAMITGRKRA